MYFVYIIKSLKTKRHYCGSCKDTDERVKQHNSGYVVSTKNQRPWVLIHAESFNTRQESYRREMQIKRYKGGEAFKKLVNK